MKTLKLRCAEWNCTLGKLGNAEVASMDFLGIRDRPSCLECSFERLDISIPLIGMTKGDARDQKQRD